MSLSLPVFELRNVKRFFYYFLAFNALVSIVSIIIKALFTFNIPGDNLITNNTWPILIILLVASYAVGWKSKKELKTVLKTSDIEVQFVKYETYYKRKLVWNAFSIVVSAVFFLVTNKYLFFYILITQMILSIAFYPRNKLISTELKNAEIVFA
ncbi:hypothetical protein [Flavitalea sp.]|nr:hypothetical protein [Flavitalea sp.]